MPSTTTFGEFPGVRVETVGGAIAGVVVGRENNFVLVGEAILSGTNGGSANVNEATTINSSVDAHRTFGQDTNGNDSELAAGLKEARSNGANIDFMWGVALDFTSETDEAISAQSGTLDNAPIREDASTITVSDSGGGDLDLEFRYASPPPTPGDADTAFINPITAEFEADAGPDGAQYEIDYDWPDWDAALTEARTVFDSEETGVIGALTESESVASTLSTDVNELRSSYKLANGVSVAEPNDDDGGAAYDTGNYGTSIDNDAYFLHAPGRKSGSDHLITGAVGGKMAGAPLGPDGSVYHDVIDVDDLDVRFDDSAADDMRDENVIPIVQPQSGGDVIMDDNKSTSTETNYPRDYWWRRIIDQTILIAKAVGDNVLGSINDDDSRRDVRDQIEVEIRGLVNQRLLQPVPGEDWSVEVYEIDSETVGIDLGITPTGIAKRVDTTVTIDT